MRIWILAVLLAVGCKEKAKPRGAGSATQIGAHEAVDWKACDSALAKAALAPLDARPQIVIDGCRVCGDWKPLLAWARPASEGGAKPEQIEATMTACNGFCTGDAKLKFMAAVDTARGTSARTPWRQLARACKDKVSAVPDDRFMSAPYFALDRIARAASAHGGDTAAKLTSLQLPLPAVTVTGEGAVLPDLAQSVSPKVGELHITLLGDAIYVGKMPRAKLGASGVQIELGPDGYPGTAVPLAELGSMLGKLVGDDRTQTVTMLAPHAMPAEKLVPVIAAASAVVPVYLAANALESPEGWPLPGAVPIALEGAGSQAISITPEMTVANLAAELVKHVAQKQPRIGVTTK